MFILDVVIVVVGVEVTTVVVVAFVLFDVLPDSYPELFRPA